MFPYDSMQYVVCSTFVYSYISMSVYFYFLDLWCARSQRSEPEASCGERSHPQQSIILLGMSYVVCSVQQYSSMWCIVHGIWYMMIQCIVYHVYYIYIYVIEHITVYQDTTSYRLNRLIPFGIQNCSALSFRIVRCLTSQAYMDSPSNLLAAQYLGPKWTIVQERGR